VSEARRDAEKAKKAAVGAEQRRHRAPTSARATQKTDSRTNVNDFKSLTKQQLLELPLAQAVEGRSSMTKAELVTGLKKASRRTTRTK